MTILIWCLLGRLTVIGKDFLWAGDAFGRITTAVYRGLGVSNGAGAGGTSDVAFVAMHVPDIPIIPR
jgi:hypothetical protein